MYRWRDSPEEEELTAFPEAQGQRMMRKDGSQFRIRESEVGNFNSDSLYLLCKRKRREANLRP